MARPTAPLWLARPGRFAAAPRGRAWLVLLLLALLLAASQLALGVPAAPPRSAPHPGAPASDLALYESVVAAMRGGANYYDAAADALRAGNYPLRPFITFRLPGLAVLLAALPPALSAGLLYALAAAVLLAWSARLFAALPRLLPRVAALLLLGAGMIAFVQPGLIAFHEIWAAQLIALSLALRRPGHWLTAVAVALIAMLIRETAALYALVMALIAWHEGQRREACGWGLALLVFGAVLGVHAWAVAGVTGPLDPHSPGWNGLLGFGFYLKSVVQATALATTPLWAAALVGALALFGWTAWKDPLALRMAAVLAAYGAAIGIFGRLDTFYWGLMVTPVFLVGLVFVPDALRDLVAAITARRRRGRVRVVAR
jgi:hypothetical protein